MDFRATNRNYPGGTKTVIKKFLPSWAIGAQQNKAKHNKWLHFAKNFDPNRRSSTAGHRAVEEGG